MGLLVSLLMLVSSIWWLAVAVHGVQSTSSKSQMLDVLLQDYAYRGFVGPTTGVPYDGNVPANLTGIKIAAMRLRSGSLRSRGVSTYKEFSIPVGIIGQPYVERLILVYQNLGNWSQVYYPLPGYTYLAPVLGLLAYDASNLSATNLHELDIKTTDKPISIVFSDVRSVPDGSSAKCVWFDLHGAVNFTNVTSGNMCSTTEQGHFSLVIESMAQAPAPAPGRVSPIAPTGGENKKSNSKVWISVGSVLGGFILLVLLSLLILWAHKYKRRKKIQEMEKAAEGGEALQTSVIRDTKAPSARMTRTQPMLENEFLT